MINNTYGPYSHAHNRYNPIASEDRVVSLTKLCKTGQLINHLDLVNDEDLNHYLHLACKHGHTNLIEALSNMGADLHSKDDLESTSLHTRMSHF